VDARIHVLTGARSGLVWPLPPTTVLVGRDADADLRFSPEGDRAVSARHATLSHVAGRWRIRDLGSRNGTFLNGERIEGDTELSEGDRIAFGAGGPLVEFRLLASDRYGRTAAGEEPGRTGIEIAGGPRPGQPPTETLTPTERIRVQVARGTARLRTTAAGLAIVLALLILGFSYTAYLNYRDRSDWERERARLIQQIDMAGHQSDQALLALEGERRELAEALQRSEEQLGDLRAQLARAEARGDQAEVAELRRELEGVSATLERQQAAAAIDFTGVERRNWRAVALIFAESADGVVSTGTAFAVRPDGTLLTSRHLVLDEENRPARRLAIQFAGSTQVWPARLTATSVEADIAVVKVDQIVGDVPTVQGLNTRIDTLPIGTPVALLGFPLGGRTARPGRTAAVPVLTSAVLTDHRPDRLELRGYGATGASGSPVFDRNGEIVAVVFGGASDPSGRAVLAVPAALVYGMLRSVSPDQ
jgi:pSer/pThr/pTyr-binding forkhead associated (FHA) protein/S1-C subfamily serine protease